MVLKPRYERRVHRLCIITWSYLERDADAHKVSHSGGLFFIMEKLNNPKLNKSQCIVFFFGKCPFCLWGMLIKWDRKKADCNKCGRFWTIYEGL